MMEPDNRSRLGRRWLEDWLPALLLGGVAAWLYAGGLHSPFVYDDVNTVVKNQSIRDLGDIAAVLRYDTFRPMVNLTYAIDHALWGPDPLGFHLTNIVLHAFNVALVFILLSRLVEDSLVPERAAWHIDARPARMIPFVGAALFAVHPMMTESVAYVSGRSDVLSGTFTLIALLLMRQGLVNGRARWMALSLLCFVIGLASKEVAIMFPFLVLAYDRLILRPSGAEARRRLLRLHLPLIGAVLLMGAVRATFFLVVERSFSPQSLKLMLRYLSYEFEGIWTYVRLLALPLHQSIAHNVSGRVVLSVLGALALGATCVLAYRMRARGPLVSFGVVWFLLLLVPTSSIIPLEHPVAEHRVYLASMGFFLIVATLVAGLDQRLRWRPVGLLVGLAAAGILALVGLASLTMWRIVVWSHPVALWREAAITAPRGDTFMGLGNALRDADDCERAVVAYRIASQLAPDSLIPLGASVICLTVLGRTTEAQEVVNRIRQVDPTLHRLCTEAHAFAARTLSVESCIERLRPYLGPNSGR